MRSFSPTARVAAAVAGLLLLAGCAATTATTASTRLEAPETPAALVSVGTLSSYCARHNADVVSEQLCAAAPIESLSDLQQALGVAQIDPKRGNGIGGNASFALLAHSTSSAARLVSPINPRAFLFSSPASVGRLGAVHDLEGDDERGGERPNANFLVLAFTRGEQAVELVTRDRRSDELRFVLLRFEQACNTKAGGCSSFDLFSSAIERDWTKVEVFEDTDLKNTVLDCAPCHQPSGPGRSKVLRMNELQQPWTHFFRDLESGRSLIADYYLAHDERESYAGIAGRTIRHSQPTRLEGLVEHEGYRRQVVELDGAEIGYGMSRGVPAEQSQTWWRLFRDEQSNRGMPVPAPMARPHDEAKLRPAAAAYRAAMAGKLAPGAMPSLADLQRKDSSWMSSLRPKPDSSGPEMLQQMCTRCHNPDLDQSISRARFDVPRLRELDAAEREEAVARLLLPDDSPKKMPPPRFGRLSDSEISAMIRTLRD